MGRRRTLEIPLSPFRDPVDARDPRYFAAWLRQLAGQAGAYVVRDTDQGRIAYVGGSGGKGGSRGDLYTIITRHLQRMMVKGADRPAGTFYDRGTVEIAYTLCRPEQAPEVERALIEALRPRDNLRLVGIEVEGDEDLTEEQLEEVVAAAVQELEGAPF